MNELSCISNEQTIFKEFVIDCKSMFNGLIDKNIYLASYCHIM